MYRLDIFMVYEILFDQKFLLVSSIFHFHLLHLLEYISVFSQLKFLFPPHFALLNSIERLSIKLLTFLILLTCYYLNTFL